MGKLSKTQQLEVLETLGEVFQGILAQTRYGDQTLRVINSRDILDGEVNLEPSQIQTIAPPSDLQKQWLRPGDILITVRNQPVKAVLWTHQDVQTVAAQNLAIWRITDPRFNPAFALLYLNSSEGQRVLNQDVSASSKVTFLKLSSLRAIPIPLPPLETQHQLVQLSQAIHQAEKATHQALEARRVFLQTLIHEALGGQ